MDHEALYDDDGFTEIWVIIQESGLYGGAPPLEYRTHSVVPHNDKKFGLQYVALLNRKTDLPFYLAKVRIRVDQETLYEVRDSDLAMHGLELLPDKPKFGD